MAAPKKPLTFFQKTQKYTGNTLGTAAGFAAGVAVAPALAPEVNDLVNAAWHLHATRIPDAVLLAAGVAQHQIDRPTAEDWARYRGYNSERFGALVNIANTGPGVGEGFRLWRRGAIDDNGFDRVLQRAALEDEWRVALAKTKQEPLDPAQLAAAIHRNIIPDPGYLVGQQPGPDRKVQAFPQIQIDANREAAWAGLDHDHLHALVGLQGLPMGPHEAAQAEFRGVITFDDYLAAIAQSNTRNEWFQAIYDQSRQIPTSHEYVEHTLRGYADAAAMRAGAARHGMTPEDIQILFDNAGRPLAIHQITTGLARGGAFHPEGTEQKDPFQAAVRESNIKPAYYDLAIANKYTMPSVLAIRQLATSGAWDPAKVEERLLWSGWYPPDAHDVAQAWSKSTPGASKEATAADILTLYDGERQTRAQASTELVALGYPADEAAKKLDLVDARRVVGAKQAAIGDLHTSFKKGELSVASTTTALESLGVATWAVPQMIRAWTAYLTAEGGAPRA